MRFWRTWLWAAGFWTGPWTWIAAGIARVAATSSQ
ncbi:unknown protein [Waddlia chondrophila 2032/99]|uniref:Uncharacterized protein n=1 Tax=Waddlia chondrophila 2032/99 TaxID=765953 RepID=F8LD13_9BACT|nr:unknown protein [Waddlia chondrophila 2032/99]